MSYLKQVFRSFFTIFLLMVVPSCVSSNDTSPIYKINDAAGKGNLVPVIIIGSGPAGLSAALYTGRSQIKTLVIEGNEPGGQLMRTTYIENWPGTGRKLAPKVMATLREQAADAGSDFLADSVERVDFSSWPFKVFTQGGHQLHAMAVIITTGADSRTLDVPGEQEYWGQGVSVCALCDAPLYKGEDVVIVGGGDSAVEEAIQLAAYARKVTILVRKRHMRAAPVMQKRLHGYPNIVVMHNREVQEIIGDGNAVTGVRLLNNLTKEESILPISGFFLAIGRIPNTHFFKDFIDMASSGHIVMRGRTQMTSLPGVFAAGDVSDPVYKQAGVSAGDGSKAGIDAERFLSEIGLNKITTKKLESSFFYVDEVDTGDFELDSVRTLAEYRKKVKKSKGIVILDFFTYHCPSCLQMLPKLRGAAKKFDGKVAIYKVDAEKSIDLVEHLSVRQVPLLIVFKDGKELSRHQELTREEIYELCEQLI